MRAAFALQKLHTSFQQKYSGIRDIYICNFNEVLINDVISFEQLGPAVLETHHKFQEEFFAESVEIFESLIAPVFHRLHPSLFKVKTNKEFNVLVP